MAGFNMDDYVDVAQRIHDFYERFPDGSLRTGTPPYLTEANGKTFVVYHAQAFRTPEDSLPGDGWAWEPVPGPTQFTKDSELMNAETAAWGRAIVSLGFATKKIASRQEVQNRRSETATGTAEAGASEAPSGGAPADTNGHDPKFITPGQKGQVGRLWAIARANNVEEERVREIVLNIAGVDSTAKITVDKYDEICHAIQFDEVPFK